MRIDARSIDFKKVGIFLLSSFLCSILAIIIGCGLNLCSKNKSSNERNSGKYNFILLTIDCLRDDALSCYGNPSMTSPYIDRFFKKRTIFTSMYSQSGWTSPSLISMFTSVLPSVHGVDIKKASIKPGIKTFAHLFSEKRYEVPDICYLFVVSKENYSNLGFEQVGYGLPPHEDFNHSILDWLEKNRNKPFFVWYHYPVLHLPYNPPETYKTLYTENVEKDIFENEIFSKIMKLSRISKSELFHGMKKPFDRISSDQRENLTRATRSLYNGDLRNLDKMLGDLFKKLEELDLLDNTIVILTADHGEEILDHGSIGHASTSLSGTLYEEIIHIPFMISVPDRTNKRISDAMVQGIDVLPTIYDLNGWDEEKNFTGNSFASRIYKKSSCSHSKDYIFSETTPCGYNCDDENYKIKIRSLRYRDWKLITHFDQEKPLETELYNIKDDPQEKRNLASSESDVVDELYGRMVKMMKQEKK
jgi:choline-sulfatase